MKSGIDTIALFRDRRREFDKLSNEDAGILIKAIFALADGDEPNMDGASDMLDLIYPMIIEETERLRDVREKRAATKKNQNETKTEPKLNQNETKTEHHNQSQSQDHNKSPNGDKEKAPTGPKRKAEPFQELFADTPELNQDFVCEAWEAWLEVRRRKKVPWTADAAVLNAKNLKKLSRGDPIRAVKILEQSTEQGWQGLFELKSQGKNGKIDWEAI